MAKLRLKTAKLKWNSAGLVTKPNPKAQKAFEKVARWMRRIAERYGIHYVSIFTFVNGTVDITAKDVDNNYIIEEYTTWQK